jgi:hypothetical protein
MMLGQLNKGLIFAQISTDEKIQDDHRYCREYLRSSASFYLRSSAQCNSYLSYNAL